MLNELNQLSLYQVVKQIGCKKLSSEEVARASIDRIMEREPVIRAFESFDADRVLAAAKRQDQLTRPGSLAGALIGIKDIIDVEGYPARRGSPIYAARRPMEDASCVALAKAAGALVAGKTVTTEFAYFYPGKTVNPHNRAHTPGGSSMGSAAAVADCMLPFAFGTQTAASVIRPAAYCGIIGYKASFGSFDLQGVSGLAASLDTLGFLCRDLRDIPLVRSVLCGDDQTIGSRADHDPPRIGFTRTAHWDMAEASTQLEFDRCLQQIESHGATVEEIPLPPWTGNLADWHHQVMAFEAARARAYEYCTHRDQLSDQFVDLVETGWQVKRADYLEALKAAQAGREEIGRLLFDRYDVLLAPSAPGEAPAGLAATGNPIFSRMWTLLHVPCITIPVGSGPNGLPLGIQLIGRYNHDNQLVTDTEWVQRALA